MPGPARDDPDPPVRLRHGLQQGEQHDAVDTGVDMDTERCFRGNWMEVDVLIHIHGVLRYSWYRLFVGANRTINTERMTMFTDDKYRNLNDNAINYRAMSIFTFALAFSGFTSFQIWFLSHQNSQFPALPTKPSK